MSGRADDQGRAGGRSPGEPGGLPKPLSRLLHLYFRLRRGMTLGVRAVVLRGGNEVFLVRHTYTAGWHLPGGGVETGETLLQALEKELHEEARIRLTGAPLLHGVFFNRAISRRDHVAVFVVRDFVVEEAKRPDREIAEAGFFALDDLPATTTAGTRRRLGEVLAGDPASADW